MVAASEAQESKAERTPARRGWFRRLIPLGVVAAAAVVVGLVATMPNETAPVPAESQRAGIPPVNVKVRHVQVMPELADTLDLTAVVEPDRVVRVAAEITGRIEKIGCRADRTAGFSPRGDPERAAGFSPRGATDLSGAPSLDENPHGLQAAPHCTILQEGEPVAQGDPIIHLNTDLLQARLERIRAQFNYDQREHRRILGLFEREASSKTELDDARTRRDVSKALLDEALAYAKRTVVVAPISGILNRLPMEVGEYVTPGDCVAEIVDIDRVKVVVDVPERDVHYLKVGDTAIIFVHIPQAKEVTGEITYISELADDQTRTTRVEITVDNREHLLRSGQIVRARLTRRILTDVIMVPLGAVIPLEHGKAVYVVNHDGRAERRLVELGFIKGRSVRILSGLEDGDRLIVAGHRYVGPNQPVAVVSEPRASAREEQ
ncbi:MAG: efflux RND transporter periplasmic adaptor subunit [Phycisphaerae bacterium]